MKGNMKGKQGKEENIYTMKKKTPSGTNQKYRRVNLERIIISFVIIFLRFFLFISTENKNKKKSVPCNKKSFCLSGRNKTKVYANLSKSTSTKPKKKNKRKYFE